MCFAQSQYKGNHKGGRPKAASFALALNKAHVQALNTAHVLRLNKADVLALNKAHVLRLNNKVLCFSTTLKFARNLPVKKKATHVNAEAPGAQKVTQLEREGVILNNIK